MSVSEDKLRLVFMGTPVFALPLLEAAARVGDVVTVVTQPDRPSGRKRELTPPPVKVFAVRRGIGVYQPENISHTDVIREIEKLKPDLIVAAAYGAILKRPLLELPPLGCINIHPSLLPCYRGPCPVEWAIINGDSVTGVSCIYMNEEMDTGDIITQRKLKICISDTKDTLSEKLSKLGAEILLEVINNLRKGRVKAYPQKGEVSYAPFIKKKDCCIDWGRESLSIHNLVRALNPNPGARTSADGKGVIIRETALPSQEEISELPGKVLGLSEDAIVVAGGSGTILLRVIQPEGGRKQTGAEYMRGHHVKEFS